MGTVTKINNAHSVIDVLDDLKSIEETIESIFVVIFVDGRPQISSCGTIAEGCMSAVILNKFAGETADE